IDHYSPQAAPKKPNPDGQTHWAICHMLDCRESFVISRSLSVVASLRAGRVALSTWTMIRCYRTRSTGPDLKGRGVSLMAVAVPAYLVGDVGHVVPTSVGASKIIYTNLPLVAHYRPLRGPSRRTASSWSVSG